MGSIQGGLSQTGFVDAPISLSSFVSVNGTENVKFETVTTVNLNFIWNIQYMRIA